MVPLAVIEEPQGYLIYQGPSKIKRKPIVAVATGFKRQSMNPKTGDMIQIYIMSAEDHPVEAARNGQDESICGNCPHKAYTGAGTCYVNLGFGPAAIWQGLKRNIYPKTTPKQTQELLKDKMVRLGSYGDPAALPLTLVRTILKKAAGWTGYTHQWKDFPQLKKYVMASCDNSQEYVEARTKGWRTFRIRKVTEPILPGEFICPASKEAGKRKTCNECLACDGTKDNPNRANPVIIVHGQRYKKQRFNKAA